MIDPLALCVVPALTHLTKVDESLLPRAEALRDFTATNSQHLSFKVANSLTGTHTAQHTVFTHTERCPIIPTWCSVTFDRVVW